MIVVLLPILFAIATSASIEDVRAVQKFGAELKARSASLQHADSDRRFDLNDLKRCGVNIEFMLRLDAIVGVLVNHIVEISPETLRRDEMAVFIARFWDKWKTLSKITKSFEYLHTVFARHSWRLQHAILFRTPAPLHILDEVVFLNWTVSELQRISGMTTTTCLLLIACHVVFADRPQADDEYHDLNQVMASIAEDKLPPTDRTLAAGLQLPSHLEMLLYCWAMLLGYNQIQEVGEAAASQLPIPELEPIMFLMAILYQVAYMPQQSFEHYLNVIEDLHLVRDSSLDISLALAYYMQKDQRLSRHIAFDIFATGLPLDILSNSFNMEIDDSLLTKTDMCVAVIHSLIESSLLSLQHPSAFNSLKKSARTPDQYSSSGIRSSPIKVPKALKHLFSKKSSDSRSSASITTGSPYRPSTSPSVVATMLEQVGIKKPRLTLFRCVQALKSSVVELDGHRRTIS